MRGGIRLTETIGGGLEGVEHVASETISNWIFAERNFSRMTPIVEPEEAEGNEAEYQNVQVQTHL